RRHERRVGHRSPQTGRYLGELCGVRDDDAATREIAIEVPELIAAVVHRRTQVVAKPVVDCQLGVEAAVVLAVASPMSRVRVAVGGVLRVARKTWQADEEVSERASRVGAVEGVTSVFLPREEGDLVLVFDVLPVHPGLQRVTTANNRGVVAELVGATEGR